MTTNIQTVNSVPSHQFLHYFGFHIALMKRGYDGEPSELQEGIGKHYDDYDCIDKFEKLSHVEHYLKFYYKERLDNYSARLSKLQWKISTIFKQPFFIFGFSPKLKRNIEELKTIKEQYKKLLADPLTYTPIKKLDEHINIPKYLIGEQDYYYYPSLVRSRLVIRKLHVGQRIIEKASHFPPYTHCFSYDFYDINDKNFKLHYSFLSLFTFDGIKWGNELGNDMLFLSEEDAKNHVTEFYKDQLTTIA
jgi:hypothetical protein